MCGKDLFRHLQKNLLEKNRFATRRKKVYEDSPIYPQWSSSSVVRKNTESLRTFLSQNI